MAKAVITLTDDGDQLDISVDFDPPVDNREGALNPFTHVAAIIAVEAIAEALGSE